jgi:hypothetical protein
MRSTRIFAHFAPQEITVTTTQRDSLIDRKRGGREAQSSRALRLQLPPALNREAQISQESANCALRAHTTLLAGNLTLDTKIFALRARQFCTASKKLTYFQENPPTVPTPRRAEIEIHLNACRNTGTPTTGNHFALGARQFCTASKQRTYFPENPLTIPVPQRAEIERHI